MAALPRRKTRPPGRALIAGVGWVVQAVADVPLGAFADAVGRKVTVVSGTCLLTLGFALLAVLPGFLGVATGYLFWADGLHRPDASRRGQRDRHLRAAAGVHPARV